MEGLGGPEIYRRNIIVLCMYSMHLTYFTQHYN